VAGENELENEPDVSRHVPSDWAVVPEGQFAGAMEECLIEEFRAEFIELEDITDPPL
jgi:hypothetical protein